MAAALRPADAPPPKPAPADGTEPPAPAPTPTPEPAPEAAKTEPPVGDTPAAPEAATEPPAEPATPEPAPAAEPEPEPDEVTPVTADRIRIRRNKDDELGRLADAFQLRNRDWTADQCMSAAKDRLGVKPATPDAPAKPEPVGNPDLPQSIVAVDSAIEQLEAEKLEAAKNLDVLKTAELDGKIRRLDRHRDQIERRETQVAAQQEAQRATEYDTHFVASEQRAADFYPDAAKPESDFGKRMVEVEESLKDLNDPLYFDPDKPLKIAQMVARERNIAPRKPGAKAAAIPVAPPKPPAPPKGILPTGGSKTAPAPAVQPVVEKIHAVKTPHDLQVLMRSLGKKDF